MKSLSLFMSILIAAAAPAVSRADSDIETASVTYQIGPDTFEGYVARPAKVVGLVPGVLVAHDWSGFGPFSKARADQLARLGYIALALDMYGKGIHAANPQEAGKLAAPFYKDFSLFRTRSQAALAELLKLPGVDPKRIGAIGFCFGGTTVLELARGGADLKGVVTFHGGLKTPHPEDAKNIKAQLLILTGAIDPIVPPADIDVFMTSMNEAGVSYKLIAYARCVHAFTNPEAGNDITKPTAYNPQAAEAAYAEMRNFFGDLFAGAPAPIASVR